MNQTLPRWSLAVASLVAVGCAGPLADEPDGERLGTVQAALTNVIEAETATGAGAIENDATASAGALLSLTVVGSTATAAFSTTGPMQSGTVRVRAACAGSMLRVRVDGIDVGTPMNIPTTWTDYGLSLPGLGAGAHTISFNYRTGTNECALRVDRATIQTADPPPPPQQILVEAEAATGAGTVGADPAASGGQYREFTTVYSTATTTFSNSAPIAWGNVRVRSSGCSTQPWVKVTIDGSQVIVAQLTSSTWSDLPLQVAWLPAGTHTAVFEYRWGPAGCALRVDRLFLMTQ